MHQPRAHGHFSTPALPPKHFRAAERPGVYCRVIEEGTIACGDAVRYESYIGIRVSALELFRDFFTPTADAATIRRYLATPLAHRARRDKEVQLERLLAAQAV
jgi:MOSC domain-containing protein YiiM